MKNARIGLIGYKLMGRVHSRAYQDVKMFFSSPILPIKSIICGRHEEAVKKAQKELEWGEYEKDWSKMIEREDVDIVDICTPVYLHRDIAVAAARKYLPFSSSLPPRLANRSRFSSYVAS